MPVSNNPIPPHTQPLIQARDITIVRQGQYILNDINIDLAPAEIVTLIGLNGAGKTTLVKVLAGLMLPDSGYIKRKKHLRVGYCPQHIRFDPTLPMSVNHFLSLVDAKRQTNIPAVLEEVGIGNLATHALSQLSGGELRRLLLARALLRRPQILLLDEPLAGVDLSGQTNLYQLISRLRERYGYGVLLVSHDIHLVMATTDRVVCINRHICCSGKPENIATHPEFVSLFGNQVANTLAIYRHRHDHAHSLHGDKPVSSYEQGDHVPFDQ